MMEMLTYLGCILIVLNPCIGDQEIYRDPKFLESLRIAESRDDVCAIGDKLLTNKAYGAYQIRKPYYDDAVRFDPSLKSEGTFPDSVYGEGSEDYSARVVKTYLGSYGTEDRLQRQPTLQDYARIHNGGPNGYMKDSTRGYGENVESIYNGLSRDKRDVGNCTFACNRNQCCGTAGCNCLGSSGLPVLCDSLSGAKKEASQYHLLLTFLVIVPFLLC